MSPDKSLSKMVGCPSVARAAEEERGERRGEERERGGGGLLGGSSIAHLHVFPISTPQHHKILKVNDSDYRILPSAADTSDIRQEKERENVECLLVGGVR